MKKLIYSTLILGLTVVLFAFSPVDYTKFSYVELELNAAEFGAAEAGSFQEAEHLKTTDDKGVWYKRYRIWTDFAGSSSVENLETIITRN